MINCLIVEDEPASREVLETYIADCSNLNLIKSCTNAIEASEVLKDQTVDLLFLDINMPKLSGMNFYRSLIDPPYVIFTTAYPEYAVEGFEVNALDYLLKPFPFDRFFKAVNKASEIIQKKKKNLGNTEYILLKADKKIHRIALKGVWHLESIGDYVKVHFADKSIIVHDTFQGLLSQFPDNLIMRVHKSHAISLNDFDFVEGNHIKIKGKTIPIGQTYRKKFMKRIQEQKVGTKF